MLYFLVSGRYPVMGSTLADIHAAHAEGRVESLAAVRSDLPGDLVDVVEQALAGDRGDRFATAEEFAQALDDAETDAGEDAAVSRAGATTENRQAHRCFLQGRHFWNRRYSGGLPKALEHYRRAVELDPEFALAHLGVADCLNILNFTQYLRPRDGFAAARASIERAIELAPDLGEAQASLGWINLWYDWDFAAAEDHFRLAIQRCPQYGLARQWLALLLATMARDDEAMAEIEACREWDPDSLVIGAEGFVLFLADRLDDSIEFYRVSLEAEPDSVNLNTCKGVAHMYNGETEDAESCLRHAIRDSGGEYTLPVAALANTLIRGGREDEAREQMEYLTTLAQRRYVSNYDRMTPWLDLGRYDEWGPLLDRAIEERDPHLVWLRRGPAFDRWLDDLRFADPLRRAGLLA